MASGAGTPKMTQRQSALLCALAAMALSGCDGPTAGSMAMGSKPGASQAQVQAQTQATPAASAQRPARELSVVSAPMAAAPAAPVAPTPPAPVLSVAKATPDLSSAPKDGGDVPAMLASLEAERSALLKLSGDGAQARVELPKRALKRGSKGPDAKLLCRALAARGFGACDEAGSEVDEAMEASIKAAQGSYGLVEDGMADAQLYNALSLPASERAARLGDLIQEWRSIEAQAAALGASRYVVVNIPSFEIKAVANDKVELVSRAVVGRSDRQTPLGMMTMTALKFNPNWTPPPGILKKDVYPHLARGDYNWIAHHGLVLLDKNGRQTSMSGLSEGAIRSGGYRFVQPAGDSAALGKLKFETDSPQNIYLHDTNERNLFALAMRAKSSGCVRVKEWRDLASWAAYEPESGIESKVATKRTFFQKTERIPVFVIYQTADFQNGKSVVYPDIYNRAGKSRPQSAQVKTAQSVG